jgi:hypothetical protein
MVVFRATGKSARVAACLATEFVGLSRVRLGPFLDFGAQAVMDRDDGKPYF